MDTLKQTIIGIRNRLVAVSAVTNLVGQRIYTDAPQKATFPFILLSITAAPWDAKDFSGMMPTVRVQAFDKTKKMDVVADIQAAVLGALDRQESNITIAGHDLTLCQKGALIDISKQPDGVVWQSITDFNLMVV